MIRRNYRTPDLHEFRNIRGLISNDLDYKIRDDQRYDKSRLRFPATFWALRHAQTCTPSHLDSPQPQLHRPVRGIGRLQAL